MNTASAKIPKQEEHRTFESKNTNKKDNYFSWFLPMQSEKPLQFLASSAESALDCWTAVSKTLAEHGAFVTEASLNFSEEHNKQARKVLEIYESASSMAVKTTGAAFNNAAELINTTSIKFNDNVQSALEKIGSSK
jgi:hypothetical protein